ncbi:hypothetical protein [Baekduia sp. Peel2402]|uniref:hypothetical protein n=1 Tax=Baekduia sp. Peel2402 TaxID=3458296 RepID=UPI00403EF0A4
MPRLPGRKAVPWMLLLESAMVLRAHWGRLDDHDRRALNQIVRKSHGNPTNLTKNDRSELLRIMGRLDLLTAGRKMLPFRGFVRPGR